MKCFGCEKEADQGMVSMMTPNGEIHLCGLRGGQRPKRACLVDALENMHNHNRCPVCRGYASLSEGFHVVCPACQDSIDAGKRAIEIQQASNEEQANLFLSNAFEIMKDQWQHYPDRTMQTDQIKRIFAKSDFFQFAQKYIEKLVNDAFLRGLRFGQVSIAEAIKKAEVESQQLERHVVLFASDVRPPKEDRH